MAVTAVVMHGASVAVSRSCGEQKQQNYFYIVPSGKAPINAFDTLWTEGPESGCWGVESRILTA